MEQKETYFPVRMKLPMYARHSSAIFFSKTVITVVAFCTHPVSIYRAVFHRERAWR